MSVEQLIKNYDGIKGNRSNFDTYWQTLHDYYYLEASDVNKAYHPGTELDFDYLYDSFSLNASDILAAGLTNYLTPPTSKWFSLRTKDPAKMESKPVLMWMKDVEAEIYHSLNNSNFYNQVTPFYKGSGVYGTSVMLEEEDLEDNIRFYDLPVKQLGIVEDARQRIMEYYLEFEYTATEAVTRFGIDEVSDKVRECYIKGGRQADKKFKFLLVIAPRHERDPYKQDTSNMPISAKWIDVENKKLMQESGYTTMPAVTHRFYKRSGIPWGFSPGMKALANVRWLNAMAKTVLRSSMKVSDPAMALPYNSFILPLNLNPRALNYYKPNAMGKDDIFPVGNYGQPNVNMEMMNYHVQSIRDLMFTDVFLAFDGITKQMTVPEVMQKVTEKMTLLGPAVGRYQSDVLNPIIRRTMGILMKAGKLPPLPDELIDDPNYEIEYTSALALAQKNSEIQALQNALGMAVNIAQYKPEVLDKIDGDKALDVTWGILGADISVLKDDKEVADFRQAKAEAMAQEQQMQQMQQGADIAKTASEVDKNIQQSQKE